MPALRLAIVTCMDVRLDIAAVLGLRPGEAHILRNAGGVITDDTVRSLALSQRRLGTRDVAIVQHTDCGLQKVREEEFRAELEAAGGVAPRFAIEAFADVDESVRESVRRARHSPFLVNGGEVRGFVYDVAGGRLREVGTVAARAEQTGR